MKTLSLDAMPVPLGNSETVAWVDPCDWEWALSLGWSSRKHKYDYAETSVGRKVTKRLGVTRAMHRMVAARMGLDMSGCIDHRDGNGLNNTRANLRSATVAQNCANTRPRNTNTSGFKGVSWNNADKKWRAQGAIKGTFRFLGNFDSPESAARVYDAWAKAQYGEYAWLNFKDVA